MSAMPDVWEAYDASLTERAWNELDCAVEAMQTALYDAELPERSVQAEQISFALHAHEPVVTGSDDDGDPIIRCVCGGQGQWETLTDHLAYIAAGVYAEDRCTEAFGQLDRTRDAIDHLRPAAAWSWGDTVREFRR